MTGRVGAIRRHPVKADGREVPKKVALEAERTMPADRVGKIAPGALPLPATTGWANCAYVRHAARAPE